MSRAGCLLRPSLLVAAATVCFAGQPSGRASILLSSAVSLQRDAGMNARHMSGGGGLPSSRLPAPRLLSLRGGGNSLGVDGEAITEEQAGEELIKAATSGDVHGLDPAGIEYLVQAGAPVSYQDMWRRTPLHYAAREGHVTAVERLVELGADLTAEDFLARTPLHMAARKGHVVATESLVKLGSVIDHPDKNPWPNNGGRTPLHWACYKGHADIVAKLCELGADKEAVDLMKRTPLHWAARRGNADCVQVLLYMGANVHAVDSKSLKPLNLANSKESNQATQALLHSATIRGNIPTSIPEFASKPVPQPVVRAPSKKAVAPPPKKAPVPSAAAGKRAGSKSAAGRKDVPSLQEAIASVQISKPSAASAASPSKPPATSKSRAGQAAKPGGEPGLNEAVARAKARLAAQKKDKEPTWDDAQRDVPVGGSVDVKASAEDWGEKQGYSLKADGVQDETRYVREEAGWDDDAANDEEIA